MSRKAKGVLSVALSLVLLLAMAFSAAGVAGILGDPGMVALGSDGAVASDGADDGGSAVEKKANPMTVKANKVTVKYSRLKKSDQTITAKKAFTVKKAKGKVTYTKKSGNSKIKISSAGKVTVKKKLKKGSYTVKVKVKAAGNKSYKSRTKTVTLTVKVK